NQGAPIVLCAIVEFPRYHGVCEPKSIEIVSCPASALASQSTEVDSVLAQSLYNLVYHLSPHRHDHGAVRDCVGVSPNPRDCFRTERVECFGYVIISNRTHHLSHFACVSCVDDPAQLLVVAHPCICLV